MSTRIICRVDHSPDGATSGALVKIHLDGDGELWKTMERLHAAYPDCDLQAQEQDA